MRTGTAPKRVKTTQNRGCFLCSADGLRGICGDSLPCLCPDALFVEKPSCFRKMARQISTRETKNKKALRGVPEGRISADGDPGESRTLDLLLRRQSLYPTELRSHVRHPEYAKEGHMSTSAEPQGKITIKSVFHSVHPGQTALTGAFPFSRLTTAAQFGKIHALFRVRFQKNFSRGVVNCHYPFFPLIPRRAASAGCSAAAP